MAREELGQVRLDTREAGLVDAARARFAQAEKREDMPRAEVLRRLVEGLPGGDLDVARALDGSHRAHVAGGVWTEAEKVEEVVLAFHPAAGEAMRAKRRKAQAGGGA